MIGSLGMREVPYDAMMASTYKHRTKVGFCNTSMLGARAALVHTSGNVAYADHNKVRRMTYSLDTQKISLQGWNRGMAIDLEI
jgi:hypothetical protein